MAPFQTLEHGINSLNPDLTGWMVLGRLKPFASGLVEPPVFPLKGGDTQSENRLRGLSLW